MKTIVLYNMKYQNFQEIVNSTDKLKLNKVIIIKKHEKSTKLNNVET